MTKPPSDAAMKVVARWTCDMHSDCLGPDDDMPDCDHCKYHREWHARRLDAFAEAAVKEEVESIRGWLGVYVSDAVVRQFDEDNAQLDAKEKRGAK